MPAPTDTYLLLRALCDEFGRCGIAGAVTSPGSRSTPIVLSLARCGTFPCYSQIDERSAGFFALGLAKATGRPAVLACTSGTAAANYLPAVIEASEARVPLIVLTADRPPELRASGAGQAIDQLKLYGDAVRMFTEVGVDAATPQTLRWIRTLACRSVWTARGPRPGPVHLNIPLREPLVLDEPLAAGEPSGERPDGRPWVGHLGRSADAVADAERLAPLVAAAPRGVIVIGRGERPVTPAGTVSDLARAARSLSDRTGWPVLADPLSGARGDGAIAHYDALLRIPAFADAARPRAVLRIGDLPTSKPLREWLAGLDAVQLLVDPDGAWQDPAHVCDLTIDAEPAPLLDALAAAVGAEPDAAWMSAWRDADARAAGALIQTLGDELSEPRVALELGTGLPPETTLVVASSMPVRDIETVFPARETPLRVFSNRGANGIDGTIATAYGIAAASPGPTVLLTGDVTLAHDVGSLLTATRIGVPLTIVLVDNGGGGIFDFLPVAGQTDHFETHVATPPGLDVAGLAQAYGLHLLPVNDLAGLRAAVEFGLSSDGTQVVQVRTDRGENVALHRRLWDAVGAALGDQPS